MTVLWVVRHGQASFGESDYDLLSDTGKVQSQLIGTFFRKTGVVFDFLYSGIMKRQVDTAKFAANAMDYEIKTGIDSSFDEYDFTSIIESQIPGMVSDEPLLKDELKDIFKDNESFQVIFGKLMKRWMSGNYDVEGVETFLQFKQRVEKGLFKIEKEHGPQRSIALFTSGGVISVVMQLALNLSDHEAMRLGWRVQNASVSKFKISNGRVNLLMFNQMAHIDCENRPELLTYR